MHHVIRTQLRTKFRRVWMKGKGTLKTGSDKKVTDPKQAIAIGLSEARKKGVKAPQEMMCGCEDKI